MLPPPGARVILRSRLTRSGGEIDEHARRHAFYQEGLTGLRALAAGWVLLFHVNAVAGPRIISVHPFGVRIDLHPLLTVGFPHVPLPGVSGENAVRGQQVHPTGNWFWADTLTGEEPIVGNDVQVQGNGRVGLVNLVQARQRPCNGLVARVDNLRFQRWAVERGGS
jgi:hypothetical protein